jgi:hypothetical protein
MGKFLMGSDDPVIEHMRNLIDAWEAASDHRAIFLSCYAMMTHNMLLAVNRGDFEDNAWVSALLHRFAGYYFDALEAYEHESVGAPLVWQVAFDAARREHTHVLQNLILGVNAHINYDLVFALADLLGPEWVALSPEQRLARYRDHCRVNEIIYETINGVQDQVVERHSHAMDLVDKLMGPLDEWLTSSLISDWREQVWENATRLVETPQDEERQTILVGIEQRSLQRAHSILGQEGLTGLLDLV